MTLAVRGPDNSSGGHSTAYEEKELVDGSAGGRDKDRVPPDLARPDPLEGTATAIDVSGPIDLPRLREDVRGLVAASRHRSVCTVLDHGDGIDDAFAGYAPRRIGSSRADSRGLWMARQRSDVVSACRAPGAFTVRIISLC
jgi:hypothetical protein